MTGQLSTVSFGRVDEENPGKWINDGITYLTFAVPGLQSLSVGGEYVLTPKEATEKP